MERPGARRWSSKNKLYKPCRHRDLRACTAFNYAPVLFIFVETRPEVVLEKGRLIRDIHANQDTLQELEAYFSA